MRGFDLKSIDPSGLPPHARVLVADLREVELDSLGGRPFDVVLSDMAPDTTGDRLKTFYKCIKTVFYIRIIFHLSNKFCISLIF